MNETDKPRMVDLWAWGAIGAGAASHGRQCWLLQLGVDPVPAGRFVITWSDDDGATYAYWAGVGSGYDGRGWTDDRREAIEYPTALHADASLRAARRSFGDGRARHVEITEETT